MCIEEALGNRTVNCPNAIHTKSIKEFICHFRFFCLGMWVVINNQYDEKGTHLLFDVILRLYNYFTHSVLMKLFCRHCWNFHWLVKVNTLQLSAAYSPCWESYNCMTETEFDLRKWCCCRSSISGYSQARMNNILNIKLLKPNLACWPYMIFQSSTV